MEISKVVTEISQGLAEGTPESVKTQLKDIERSYLSLVDDLTSANSESKQRKIKIRQLSTELDDSKLQIESLGNDEELTRLKTENENYKVEIKEVHTERRQKFEEAYKSISTHESFDKIKDYLPKVEKEGDVLKFSDLTIQQISTGLTEINKFQQAGLFGDKKKIKTFVPLTEEGKEVDVVKMALEDPKAYAEHRKKRRGGRM